MEIRPELVAPCGLYCGVCRIYQATIEDDRAYLERLAKVYARRFPEIASVSGDALLCDGCLSARRFPSCQMCAIRECVQRRKIQGCHACSEFPCPLVDEFPIPEGKKVILRAVPFWRVHGTEAWIRAEEERYHCPECGAKLFRGVRQCSRCRTPVDVD